MKITDLHIDGFGVWSGLKLDQFSDGCTVFFGQNEAGKTTLMEFIRSVLYGYSAERRARYLPPVRGGRAGGSMGAIGAGGQFVVRRTPVQGLTGEDAGKLEVLSPNGTRQGQHILGTLLSGIDEQIFNNVFAVGLRELQELSTLDDTEAAAQLYKLTSGLDRVSLIDVMRDLEAARNRLLAVDGGKSELLELIDRREKLRAEIKDLTAAGNRWANLAVQRTELQTELARLEENIQRMERESRAVEVAIQVREDWFRRVDVAGQLKKLGRPITLPERAVERMDALNQELARHREELDQVRRQRRLLMDEALAQPIQRQVCAHAARIAAVTEHAPWLTSLEAQIGRLREELEELQTDVRARWEKLGLNPEEMPDFTPDLVDRAANLHGPARAVRDATKRVQDAKAEHEDAQREAEELKEQLASRLADTGRTELGEALEEAGLRVAGFRRRIQLEERLDKVERQRREMSEDRHALLEDQVLPLPTLLWCGLPFIGGVVMILGSFFWDWGPQFSWTMRILGFVCAAAATIVKIFLEQTVADDLDGCRRQYGKVEKQILELYAERDQLDAALPPGGGPLDSRLLAAEEYVKQLEELTPLETKRHSALQRAEAVRAKSERTQEAVRDARERWREALRSADLPASLTPEHIQHLVDGNNQTLTLGRRLQARREDLQQRQTEWSSIIQRINALFDDAQLTAASEDPRTRLRQLSAALAEQTRWMERRREMRKEHRELKGRYREHVREVRKLAQQRRVLLNQAHAVNEQQLRKLAARQAKIEALTQQHEELNTRIGLAIGTQCPEAAVGEVLDTHREDKLEQYWDRLLGRLQEAQTRLTQLHQSRGEMLQEMKTLSENRRLPAAKLDLGCLDEQIQRAVARWRLLAVTSLMLEDIRQIYETERQPETLAESSTYLAKLTEGRYRRIWTPLSQDGLRVDTAEGQSLPLDVLSQGTREAIFLSLRLALASAYARRGAVLPLVLDDVLVNLDLRRAKAAVQVLREFAAGGHQLLLFTCHHHIIRLFLQADVTVRVLPTREGQVELELEEPPAAAAPEPAPVLQEPEPAEDPPTDEAELQALIEEVVPDDEPPPAPRVRAVPEPEEPIEAPPVHQSADTDYDHTIWDEDDELELSDEEDGDQLTPAGGNGRYFAGRWWEAGTSEPAA